MVFSCAFLHDTLKIFEADVLRNYCFLGNPGTGKTTVARLFAAILHDSELRSQNVFQECGAQKVKDDGIDEFRKLAQGAMDGVLFIDEAYDLDPVGDKVKGAPIVNELVTLTENERARLTCILAGYEDRWVEWLMGLALDSLDVR